MVHSYHKGFSWTDGIEDGFRAALAQDSVEIYTEYLDSKRQPLETQERAMVTYLAQKYATITPDIIVISDNNALTLWRNHSATLFPQTPVVFCGINDYKPALLEGFEGRITGVVEKTDPAGTIQHIRALQPKAKKLYIVSGCTPTALAVKREVEAALQENSFGFTPVWLHGLSSAALQTQLHTIADTDAVLLLLFNRDAAGVYRSYTEASTFVDQATAAPVYGLWDFYLNHGIVGGIVASSTDQGREAAGLVRYILKHHIIPPVVIDSPNRPVYLWRVLRAHGLNPNLLPDGVEIRGRPRQHSWLCALLAAMGALFVLQAIFSIRGLMGRSRLSASRSMPAVFRANLRHAIVLFGITLFAGIATRTWLTNRQYVEELREQMLAEKKEILRLMVGQALDQIEYGRTKWAKSGLSEKEIKELIKEQLAAISFAHDEGYIFVTSNEGIALVNRAQPADVGKNVYQLRDRDGVALIELMITAASHPEGGFVQYQWHKPGQDQEVTKLSYSRQFHDWGWMVGSGLYLDDLEKAIAVAQRASQLHLLSDLAILFFLALVIFLVLEITSRRLMTHIYAELTELQSSIVQQQTQGIACYYQEFKIISMATAQSFKELKEAREAVNASEAQLRNILDALDAGIVIINPENHHIEYANPSAARLVEVEADQLIGTTCHQHICRAEIGQCPVIQLGKTVDNNRQELVTSSGTVVPIVKSVRPFIFNGAPALLETFVDISTQVEAENALRMERDRFAAGPVFTIAWSPETDWPVTFVSTNVEQVLGYTPLEMMAPSFRYANIIHPDDLGRISEEIKGHLESHDTHFEQSYRLRVRTGEYRWFYDFTHLIRNDQGDVTAIHGYMLDQTDLKNAECRIANERQRLSNVIEATNVATWEWNIQTGITLFNERWAEMCGYSLEELQPTTIETWRTRVHPDDLKECRRLLKAHFDGETAIYECECRMRHKDGHWIWVHDRGRVISRTDDGTPCMMFGTHFDITMRKETEYQLKAHRNELQALVKEKTNSLLEANNQLARHLEMQREIAERNILLAKVIEQSDIMTIATDLEGYIIFANQAYYQHHPAMQGDPAGDKILNHLFNQIKRHERWSNVLHVELINGSLLSIDCMIFPIHNDQGQLISMACVQRDVSHRYELEAQLLQAQKMEAIGTLAGGIAHDFNNLLMAISGFAKLSRKRVNQLPEAATIVEYLEDILCASQRGKELVAQLLSFGRPDEQLGTGPHSACELEPLIDECIKLLISSTPPGVHIHKQCSTSVTLNVNAGQIQQVLLNLGTNALQAMPDAGDLTFCLDVVHCTEEACEAFLLPVPGLYVCLKVIDTGCGISPENCKRIFDPFFTTKKVGEGTGMGLSVALGIAAKHKGSLHVESTLGQGTCFSLYLPMNTGTSPPQPEELPFSHTLTNENKEPV
jgi:PAS domain S-box-containing protein